MMAVIGEEVAGQFCLGMHGVGGLRLFYLGPMADSQDCAHQADAVVQFDDEFRHDNLPCVWARAAR